CAIPSNSCGNGSQGCKFVTVSGTVTPSVSISASTTTICSGETVIFTSTSNGGGGSPSYQWYLNGSPVGFNSSTYTTPSLTSNAQVYCVMTSSSSCANPTSATSGTTTITVVNTTPPCGVGIADIDFINNLNIHPNPNTGEFIIEMEITQPKDLEIKLLNAIGQVIYEEGLNKYAGKYQKTIDVGKQATGIYTLQLLSDEGIINRKIIIE
ncbi:MAG: T9SS type A sorting domain-containing protein, partial [Cytophagales bacterium]|nr:T9SS type A sorting domain-containing protein [Cytophagales bacterium]